MPLLSVRDVAELLGVVDQTVYTHHKAGRLVATTTEPARFGAEQVHAAKLLNEADIDEGSKHGIPRDRLLEAKLADVVFASEDGRYSLDDVALVKAWMLDPDATAARRSSDPPTPPPRVVGGTVPSLASDTGSRAEMLERYLVSGASPNDLPDDYWLTPRPPEFIPPRDTYREVVQGVMGVRQREGHPDEGRQYWQIRVWRSGYFCLKGETPVWRDPGATFLHHERDDSRVLPAAVGKPPAATRIKTLRWSAARAEWIFAWERRRDHRRALRGDAGGHLILTESAVDREAILHEYRMFFDRPADLPPEFWAGFDRPPPFEPPTNALHHRLGQWFLSGPLDQKRPMTAIARAAGWLCVEMDDEGPIWVPESPMVGTVDGRFDDDYDHTEVAKMNIPHDNALREWGPAWQKYRDYCREFG